MGGAGNGLRSRGYQVRILAAAPSNYTRSPRALIPHPTIADAMLVPLTRGLYATIDAADSELVGRFRWLAVSAAKGRRFYARGFIAGERVLLHRFLCPGTTEAGEIDHINGDSLDNRQANLRPCTRAENSRNAGRRTSNTTGFKGVTCHLGRFRAQIGVNGRVLHLGSYATPHEAHVAYVTAAVKHHGEFARAS